MNILVIGSGGREHALVWKIRQSPYVNKIYCAPGNAGIGLLAECIQYSILDIDGLIHFAKKNSIDLTVVGPEMPLVHGIVDQFQKHGLSIFGASKNASRLEGSKIYAKKFMDKYNIPTAKYKVFDDYYQATKYLNDALYPLVIKVDGLASGKGVSVCTQLFQAKQFLKYIMQDDMFGSSGEKIIIEECLSGEELSILCISDGKNSLTLESSQDHKRVFIQDYGPNTGGMGAYSPSLSVSQDMMKKIQQDIIFPTIQGMAQEGNPFCGVLYFGLMLDHHQAKVLEYNVRFGDPEVQVVLLRMKSDIIPLMLATVNGCLDQVEKIVWDERSSVCVVMSSLGYPSSYQTDKVIQGLDTSMGEIDGMIFHSGTKKNANYTLTGGGRVLSVTTLGIDIQQSIQNTYKIVRNIRFSNAYFRTDIGRRALVNIL